MAWLQENHPDSPAHLDLLGTKNTSFESPPGKFNYVEHHCKNFFVSFVSMNF